jgi:serine-type D-Ala-D-Ala carboxypeptidase (penicillin-binding protein 5/6)
MTPLKLQRPTLFAQRLCQRLVAALAVAATLIVPVHAQGTQGNAASGLPQIKAPQALVMDAETGAILFQQNADQLVPPASMSKLMTLVMIFKALKAGEIKPETEFLMSERAWRTGGAPSNTSAMFVPVGSKAKVEDLVRGIIVQSGNDAAISVAENLAGTEENFAQRMTEEARRLGMPKSVFRNATGLNHPEHLMTIRELGVLARHLIRDYAEYYPLFAQREMNYQEPRAPFRRHRFINRNPLLFLNIGVDGMKTGHLAASGFGIVVSAKQDPRRIIVIVHGLQTAQDRTEDARKLVEWGFRAFGEFKLFDSNEVVGRARVWGGEKFSVALEGQGAVSVVLPRFPSDQKLRGEIVYKGPLKAPVKKGDPVAKLRVVSSSGAANEVQLYAAEDVNPAGTWRRGFDSLLHMATRWLP